MPTPKILAFAGSAKAGSVNKHAVAAAAEGARAVGAEVVLIDLRDYPMPIMDEDLEAADGLPENVKKMKALFGEADGLLLSCPEYNGSITPLLKNTIDWVSRPDEGGGGLRFFKGKTCALVAASPGALGGLRGLVHVRAILGGLGMLMVPDQVAVTKAGAVFGDDGSILDEAMGDRLKGVGAALAQVTAKQLA
jgi:chromate reductase